MRIRKLQKSSPSLQKWWIRESWKSFPQDRMGKKVIECNQHLFVEKKHCLNNLITFYNGKNGSKGQRRAMHDVYFNFIEAFYTVSLNFHLYMMIKYRQGEWSVMWTGN